MFNSSAPLASEHCSIAASNHLYFQGLIVRFANVVP
jgi:hypothetical protein